MDTSPVKGFVSSLLSHSVYNGIMDFFGEISSIIKEMYGTNLKTYLEKKILKNRDTISIRIRIGLFYIEVFKRIDRLLPKGHRWRGDVGI